MFFVQPQRKRTIGLLISHIDGTYQSRFWQGMVRFCRSNDCDLVVFSSRFLRDRVSTHQDYDVVYRLASSRRIDALCIDSSAFRNHDDLEDFLETMPDLGRIPIVFSSSGREPRMSVHPDNADGIRQVLTHLIDVHGCSKIAFVGGPADIADARLRLEAFLETMVRRGLNVRSEWIQEASFDAPSGRIATQSLLNRSGELPEAIVYANDEMALAGLEVLEERGIAVPETVKITGFDDIDSAIHASPPLSSVAQPIEAKAWLAGRVLLDAIDGKSFAPPRHLGVRFHARESCGCTNVESVRAYADPRKAARLFLDSKRAISGISLVASSLGSVLSLADLARQLEKLGPLLGLPAIYVCLWDEESDAAPPSKHSYLVSAVGADDRTEVDPDRPRKFLSDQIVPAFVRPHATRTEWIVQSLSKAHRRFGYLVTEISKTDPAVLVALRDAIAEALLNVRQVGEWAVSQTQLKSALDREADLHRKFRELAQTLPFFLMETTRNTTIEYLNDTAMNLLGVTPNDVENGLSLAEFLTPDPERRSMLWSTGPNEYRNVVLQSRLGRQVSILMRSVELDAQSLRRRWSGLDYKPILESLTLPDRELMERHELTKREFQVLALELRGLVAKEIASELEISLSTVKGHLGLIYRKLGVGSKDQLFHWIGQRHVARYGYESLVFSLLSELLRN